MHNKWSGSKVPTQIKQNTYVILDHITWLSIMIRYDISRIFSICTTTVRCYRYWYLYRFSWCDITVGNAGWFFHVFSIYFIQIFSLFFSCDVFVIIQPVNWTGYAKTTYSNGIKFESLVHIKCCASVKVTNISSKRSTKCWKIYQAFISKIAEVAPEKILMKVYFMFNSIFCFDHTWCLLCWKEVRAVY